MGHRGVTVAPRIDISPTKIDSVVAQFYSTIRADPDLGPIFENHIKDWSVHEAKIGLFWRNVLLGHRAYRGNPMLVHSAAGDVRPDQFPKWLRMFDQVLNESLTEPEAAAWSRLAHRIGDALSFGIQTQAERIAGDPPILSDREDY